MHGTSLGGPIADGGVGRSTTLALPFRVKHDLGTNLGGGIASAVPCVVAGVAKQSGARNRAYAWDWPTKEEPETPWPAPSALPCNACAIFIFDTAACRIERTCSRSLQGNASICATATKI